MVEEKDAIEQRKRAMELLEREIFFGGGAHPPLHLAQEGKRAPEPTIDPLTQMFRMQEALDTRIIAERGIEKTLDEWVIAVTLAMESEIDEVRREINWKHWKNPKEVDIDALQGEVIDIVHFVLSLCRIVGLTPESIHRLYMEKNAENHDRQAGLSAKEGYKVEETTSEGGEGV